MTEWAVLLLRLDSELRDRVLVAWPSLDRGDGYPGLLSLRVKELARVEAAVLVGVRLRGSSCIRSFPIPLIAGDEVGFKMGLQFALTTSSMSRALRPLKGELWLSNWGVWEESESSSPEVTGVWFRVCVRWKPRTLVNAGAAEAIIVVAGWRLVR